MAPDLPWSASSLPTQAPFSIVPAKHMSLGHRSLVSCWLNSSCSHPPWEQLQVFREKGVSDPVEALAIASEDGTGHAWCQLCPPVIHEQAGIKVLLSTSPPPRKGHIA